MIPVYATGDMVMVRWQIPSSTDQFIWLPSEIAQVGTPRRKTKIVYKVFLRVPAPPRLIGYTGAAHPHEFHFYVSETHIKPLETGDVGGILAGL